MEMERVCFRIFVTRLRRGGLKRNEDVRKGLLISGINAKMEILKRIFPRIFEKVATAESQIWFAVYTGCYKIIETPDRHTEARILLTSVERENKITS
jgi:hypothetical protein